MMTSFRSFIWCAALLAVFSIFTPAAVRADDPPNMQDANTFWQVATSAAPADTTLDANTYWQEVQAKQLYQDMTRPPQQLEQQ
jgi:hypothetical protein